MFIHVVNSNIKMTTNLQLQGSCDSLDHDKHSSLPRMKSYDAVVFDVLRVSSDEFAVSSFYFNHVYSALT